MGQLAPSPVSTRTDLVRLPGITADKLAVSSLRFNPGDWVPVVGFLAKSGNTRDALRYASGLREPGNLTDARRIHADTVVVTDAGRGMAAGLFVLQSACGHFGRWCVQPD